jgi:hypothetical protein
VAPFYTKTLSAICAGELGVSCPPFIIWRFIMKKNVLLVAILMLLTSSVYALERITGKVTIVEPTYLPASISFQMDTGNSTCPKGNWFKWSKTPENNKFVYSTLMTALVSGKKINFYINDNDSSCKGQYLHLLSN